MSLTVILRNVSCCSTPRKYRDGRTVTIISILNAIYAIIVICALIVIHAVTVVCAISILLFGENQKNNN